MVYKWCVVPQCTNTSINSPKKLFVSVPTNPKRQKVWLQLARRDPKSILSHSSVFMCEDHFDKIGKLGSNAELTIGAGTISYLSVPNFIKLRIRKFHNLSYHHHPGKEPLRPLTLGKLLENTCKTHGDIPAIIAREQNQTLTFQEVLSQADRLAAGLRAIGLNLGDRIGIWAPNLIEWYLTYMACARGGFILVNINPAYQLSELEYCVNKAGVKAIICAHHFKTQNYYNMLNQLAPEISRSESKKIKSKILPSLERIVVMSDRDLKGALKFQELFDFPSENEIKSIKDNQNRIKVDGPCHIQFTSGTTGEPKVALSSHFSMVNNSYYLGKRNEMHRKQHTILVPVPLFHAFGTVVCIAAATNHGNTLVLPSIAYNPDKNLDAIRDEKCSLLYGTPTMYVDLIDRQTSRQEDINPEVAMIGGSNCPPALLRKMKEVLNIKKIKVAYGQTECTAVVFQTDFDDDEELTTSTVGYIHEHCEAKVIDKDDNIVPMGTPGELCLRGYFTMLCYWKDEQKTKETLSSDGWIRTGDQFVLLKNGYGKIVGRLKEMIIRGGENIFPKEIEDFLNTHPSISEVYIVGVSDYRLGEEVCAFIKLEENCSLTLDELKQYCKGNIAHYKVPSILKIVNNFPRTPSGKIQKFKLINIFEKERKLEKESYTAFWENQIENTNEESTFKSTAIL